MNDLLFVERAQSLLRDRGIETWIFGGWGEELRNLIRPREHADLDLLYPSETWEEVDGLTGLDWVPGKRRPWKRAFVLRAVDLLASYGIRTWVAGGWGEELRGLAAFLARPSQRSLRDRISSLVAR